MPLGKMFLWSKKCKYGVSIGQNMCHGEAPKAAGCVACCVLRRQQLIKIQLFAVLQNIVTIRTMSRAEMADPKPIIRYMVMLSIAFTL